MHPCCPKLQDFLLFLKHLAYLASLSLLTHILQLIFLDSISLKLSFCLILPFFLKPVSYKMCLYWFFFFQLAYVLFGFAAVHYSCIGSSFFHYLNYNSSVDVLFTISFFVAFSYLIFFLTIYSWGNKLTQTTDSPTLSEMNQ